MVRLLLVAITIAAALCLGLYFGPMLMDQKGYVLIAVNEWTIETNVVVLVMLIIIFYALLQISEWIIANTWSMWGRTRHWFGWRKHRLAQQKTLSSLLDLAGGRFELAEKNSARYAPFSDQPMLNYLTAANAAQQLGKIKQRDKYLDNAAALDANDSALVVTRLAMLSSDTDAINTANWLASLDADVLNKPEVLNSALTVYQQAKQWPLVLDSAVRLHKSKQITAQAFDEIVVEAHCALLEQAAAKDLESVNQYFNQLKRKYRNSIDIFSCYAKLVINLGGFELVETRLFKLLSKPHNIGLALLLIDVKQAEACHERLLSLESIHGENVIFSATIAALYQQRRQWQQAKDWYQKALEIEPTANRYHQLAIVQQELGEKNGALMSFTKALAY